MKKPMLLRALAVVLAAAMLLGGCSVIEVNSERDRAQVVAKVGDLTILKGDFLDSADSQLAMYGMTYEDLKTDSEYKDVYESFRDEIFEYMIGTETQLYMAKQKGFYIDTPEERQKAQAEVDEQLETYKVQYRSIGETTYGYTGEALDKYVDECITKLLTDSNTTIDELVTERLESYAITRLQDEQLGGVTITDDELLQYYNELLESQRTSYQSDPAAYVEAIDSSTEPLVYQPGNGTYVKHILVKIPDDKRTEYNQLVSDEKQEEADALKQAELEKIKSRAEEALEKAKAVTSEADFDALVEEYGEDEGMKTETYKKKGYLAYEGASFTANFLQAALAFEKTGDVSDLVETEFGYHILYASNKMNEGARALEDIKTELYDSALTNKKAVAWSDLITEWITQMDKEKKIKRYKGRL